MRRWRFALLGAACALINWGCNSASISTRVAADGSCTRKLVFVGPEPSNQKEVQVESVDKAFRLPKGPGWTIEKSTKEGQMVYTATRKLTRGEAASGDLLILGQKSGTAQLTNQLSVREVSPGRLEYRETLHWSGKPPSGVPDFTTLPKETTALIKSSLPAGLATDADAAALTKEINLELVHIVLGPNQPIIGTLATHPELGLRMLRSRLAVAMDRVMQTRFGERLTADQRRASIRKLLETSSARWQEDTRYGSSNPNPPSQKNSESGGVPLTFSVELPGKVVSTNGIVDDVTGEVYWGLFAEAAAYGDVEMVAVCDVQKTARR